MIYKAFYDIEELRYLKPFADRRKVNFTLFGSTVRRFVLGITQNKKRNIFELCPFASDIDLLHTGKPEMNVYVFY
jgi:hypothetical protein